MGWQHLLEHPWLAEIHTDPEERAPAAPSVSGGVVEHPSSSILSLLPKWTEGGVEQGMGEQPLGLGVLC